MSLVYHVITDKNVGGAGCVLLSLLKHAKSKALSSRVLLPRGSALSPILAKNHISYTELDGTAESSFSFSSIRPFLQYLKRHPCDILISHASLSARLAARICGTPLLLSFKHCDVALPKHSGMLYRLLTDATVAVSENARRRLLQDGVPADRIFLLPNGAKHFSAPHPYEKETARAAFGIARNICAVGLCGRLSAVKGHATAVRALAYASPDIALYFLGEGEEKSALSALARRLGVEDRVHFCGFREDTKAFFYAMDAHISCSLASETASLALAEGMSAGCATFASDIAGNRMRVGDGGLFFPPADAKALAALLDMLTSEEVRAELSQRARLRAREIPSEEQSAWEFEKLLLRLWSKKSH